MQFIKTNWLLQHFSDDNQNPAWWDETQGWLSYQQLKPRLEALTANYPTQRSVIYLPFINQLSHVLHYLAALQAGHVVMLADPAIEQSAREQTCQQFGVAYWLDEQGQLQRTHNDVCDNIHPELMLMLPTSGSTGAAKWVRLSYRNLESNCASIIEYLKLTHHERAISSLPWFYSYGLSVLHSHLAVGASIVHCPHSPVDRQFWTCLAEQQVTSFAGVPFTYQMLSRLRFNWAKYPSLTTLTQAGGKLSAELVQQFAKQAIAQDKQFYVMYGQTEAAPRMSWLNAEDALQYPNAIGRVIPHGRFYLRDEQGQTVSTQGELIYQGENVMLGYATSAHDLAKASEYSELATGDLAALITDDIYQIIGRRSRFIKLFGKRINLAEVEHWLAEQGLNAAAINRDEQLTLAYEPTTKVLNTITIALAQWLAVPPSTIRFHEVDALPRTSNQKIDYRVLAELLI